MKRLRPANSVSYLHVCDSSIFLFCFQERYTQFKNRKKSERITTICVNQHTDRFCVHPDSKVVQGASPWQRPTHVTRITDVAQVASPNITGVSHRKENSHQKTEVWGKTTCHRHFARKRKQLLLTSQKNKLNKNAPGACPKSRAAIPLRSAHAIFSVVVRVAKLKSATTSIVF